MIRKALVFMLLVTMMANTVSAVDMGDTKITGSDRQPLPDLTVSSGEQLAIVAKLFRYDINMVGTVDCLEFLSFTLFRHGFS